MLHFNIKNKSVSPANFIQTAIYMKRTGVERHCAEDTPVSLNAFNICSLEGNGCQIPGLQHGSATYFAAVTVAGLYSVEWLANGY